MNILGLSAYHADASAALVVDGKLVAAVEEERFRRIKHWAGFPTQAIRACLEMGAVRLDQVDHIAVSRDPKAHLVRKGLFALTHRLKPAYLVERFKNLRRVGGVKEILAKEFGVAAGSIPARIHQVEHHRAHMASAFLVSPFERAAVLSIDALGDYVSTMWGRGNGNRMEVMGETMFPHSLGFFYTALTQHLGFPNYGDEYKVMGLASYGEPEFVEAMRKIVLVDGQGRVRLNLNYFRHHREGIEMTWDGGEPVIGRMYSDELVKLLGPARERSEPLTKRHENLARSLQAVFEECYFALLNHAQKATGETAVCLAGGCAMNSVANGKIFARTPFKEVYIQPAAGDAGTAIGAAFHIYSGVMGNPRSFVMNGSYWGPSYDDGAVRDVLKELGDGYRRHEATDEADLCTRTAKLLADGKVVGWFQGRMEWGARALGNRSILVDPRRAEMKDVLNARIKRREPFRPFAPSILAERVGEFFEIDYPDPFMLKVYPVKADKRSVIPAVTHVDGTGRLQTVHRDTNPRYWSLIKAFDTLTGVPVVLNTSFNENEPICCTPKEAMDCFTRTKMDALIIGLSIVEKG